MSVDLLVMPRDGRQMYRLRNLIALTLAFAATLFAVPALACTIVAAPRICADAGPACTGPLADQRRREADMAAGRAYGSALDAAITARGASPDLDRGFDLAQMLLPNLVAVVEFADVGGCGPAILDGDLGEMISEADFAVSVRAAAHLSVDAPISDFHLTLIAALQTGCNYEVRRRLAAYLNSAVPAEQLRETWAFIIPRAGMRVPADAAERITNGRLTAFAGTTLAFAETNQPPHISRRRARGWAYLRNHDNGQAVMTAIGLFIDSLPADRSPATVCPAVAAEQAQIIARLAM